MKTNSTLFSVTCPCFKFPVCLLKEILGITDVSRVMARSFNSGSHRGKSYRSSLEPVEKQ